MSTLLITVFINPSNSPNNNYRGEKNYKEAMNSENTDKWKDTINKELQNLNGNNAMKIVENKNILEDVKSLNVKWVFTIFTIKNNGI